MNGDPIRGRGRLAVLRLVGVCTRCFRVWFPAKKSQACPEGPHGRTVTQPLLARCCDLHIPLEDVQDHLQTDEPIHLRRTRLRRRERQAKP